MRYAFAEADMTEPRHDSESFTSRHNDSNPRRYRNFKNIIRGSPHRDRWPAEHRVEERPVRREEALVVRDRPVQCQHGTMTARDGFASVRRVPPMIWAAVLLALVLRVIVLVELDAPLCCDAPDYVRHGKSIAAGDGYPASVLVADGGTTVLRPPLYPYILGAIFAVSGDSLKAARTAQAVAGAVTAGLLGLLAWQVFGRRRHAVIAVLLAAVYPAFVFESNALLSEAIFLPLEIGAVCAAWKARQATTRYGLWVLVAGVLTGLAALTRQSGFLLLLPVGFALITAPVRPRGQRLRFTALAAIVSLVVVAPWTARNLVETGQFVLVGRQTGLQLAGIYNDEARTDPTRPGQWIPAIWTKRDLALFSTHGIDEIQLDRELRSRAIAYAREHPGYILEAVARNSVRMLGFDNSSVPLANQSLSVTTSQGRVVRVGWFGAAALGLAGWFTAARRRVPLWFWLSPVGFFAAGAASAGLLRYRIPIDPFVLLLATAAIASIIDRVRPDQPTAVL
jgi:4-amino-4-deoxy-L-arabinose transferase-like glycosyltransferase